MTKRIYLVVDMEGATSVFSDEEVSPGHHAYDEARKQLVAEVNAAVEGAFAGGADEVYIHDYHGGLHNFNVNELDDRAGQVRGHGMPNLHLPGVEDGFCGLVVLAAHGPRAGPESNTFAHVINGGTFESIEMNGINVGETVILAWLAGIHDVPLLFVSGESGAIEETRQIYADVENVITKRGLHYGAAISRPIGQVLDDIRETVSQAVASGGTVIKPEEPVRVTITFTSLPRAQSCDLLPECFPHRDGKKVSFTADDYFTAYRWVLAALALAGMLS